MSPAAPLNRFYTNATTALQGDGTYRILLDHRELKTPAKNTLIIANKHLADAVCAEWNAQAEIIDTDAMPLMRIFALATDRATTDRALMTLDMLRYAETDLICYFSDDAEIAAQQSQHFAPLLTWCQQHYGVKLITTHGLLPVAQDPQLVPRLQAELDALDDLALVATAMLTPLLGSILMTCALRHGVLNANDVCAAARIEEEASAARYGRDALEDAAWNTKRRDIIAAACVLTHLRMSA